MAVSNLRIQVRRDTASNWASVNPVLLQGEQGLETDTGKVKYGNGSAQWNDLDYTTINIVDNNEYDQNQVYNPTTKIARPTFVTDSESHELEISSGLGYDPISGRLIANTLAIPNLVAGATRAADVPVAMSMDDDGMLTINTEGNFITGLPAGNLEIEDQPDDIEDTEIDGDVGEGDPNAGEGIEDIGDTNTVVDTASTDDSSSSYETSNQVVETGISVQPRYINNHYNGLYLVNPKSRGNGVNALIFKTQGERGDRCLVFEQYRHLYITSNYQRGKFCFHQNGYLYIDKGGLVTWAGDIQHRTKGGSRGGNSLKFLRYSGWKYEGENMHLHYSGVHNRTFLFNRGHWSWRTPDLVMDTHGWWMKLYRRNYNWNPMLSLECVRHKTRIWGSVIRMYGEGDSNRIEWVRGNDTRKDYDIRMRMTGGNTFSFEGKNGRRVYLRINGRTLEEIIKSYVDDAISDYSLPDEPRYPEDLD